MPGAAPAVAGLRACNSKESTMYGTYCRLRVHTFASTREVIRAARTKLAPKGKTRAQREARHAFLRQMLEHHCEAQRTVRAFRL